MSDDHDRIIRVEAEQGHQAHEFAEFREQYGRDREADRAEAHGFRDEMRRAIQGVNLRLIGFAFVVAGSAVGIMLTVVFTR